MREYTAKFNRFFTDLLHREGGYAVLDGMPTNLGIEQGTYDAYRKSLNLPPVPVDNITYSEAKKLYYDMYWKPNSYEELPDNVAFIVADNAVNAGPSNANRILQSYVGTKADGIIGPKTIKAVKDYSEKHGSGTIENQVLDGIMDRYTRIAIANPEKARYLKGWGNRVTAMRKSYVTTPDEILDAPAPGVKQGGGSLKDPSQKNVSVGLKRNLNEPSVTNSDGQVIDKTKAVNPKRAPKSGSLIYGGK